MTSVQLCITIGHRHNLLVRYHDDREQAMREFFKGWRRKVGCVALVLACGVTSLWIYCINGYIATKFAVKDRVYVLMSYLSKVEFVTFERDVDTLEWCFHDGPILTKPKIDRDLDSLYMQIRGSFGAPTCQLHYLWIVLPLALLSAYLLLWKPRKKKAAPFIVQTNVERPTPNGD